MSMESQVTTIVCPNCGANTSNAHNCEYCGSILVRYTAQNKAVDEKTFGKEVPEIVGLKEALKKNLSYQKIKKPDDIVVTTVTLPTGDVQIINTPDCNFGTDTPNPFGNAYDNGVAFRITFEIRDNDVSVAEQEKSRLQWFKEQDYFFLFTPQNHATGVYYYIDFGQDVDNAAKLISSILSKEADTSEQFGIETHLVTKNDMENVTGMVLNTGQEKRKRISWIIGIITWIVVILFYIIL